MTTIESLPQEAENLPEWAQSARDAYCARARAYEAEQAEQERERRARLEAEAIALAEKVGIPYPRITSSAFVDGLVLVEADGLTFSYSPYRSLYEGSIHANLTLCRRCSDCNWWRFVGVEIRSANDLGAALIGYYAPCTNDECPSRPRHQPQPTRETATDRLMNALREVVCDIVAEERP